MVARATLISADCPNDACGCKASETGGNTADNNVLTMTNGTDIILLLLGEICIIAPPNFSLFLRMLVILIRDEFVSIYFRVQSKEYHRHLRYNN